MYAYERRPPTTPVDEPDIMGPAPKIRELLIELWPEIGPLFNNVMISCLPFVRQYYKAGARAAEDIILTQSMSDLNALMVELSDGSGRSASRTARTLVESAINRAYVISMPDAAERYVDHLDLLPKLELEFVERQSWPTSSLAKRYLGAARHAFKKHKSRINELLTAKYDSSFYRTWTPASLHDRARSVGLDSLYSAYRLLSQIAHGSSLAVVGLQRDIEGQRVVRTGPDLAACSAAYLAGMQAFLEIVRTVKLTRPNLDTGPVETTLGVALKFWPEYNKAIRAVDRKIWPKQPPGHAVAILAISKSLSKRWYWYDPDMLALIEADPPILTGRLKKSIVDLEKKILENADQFFVGTTQYATVTIAHVEVNPRPGARILPATSILIRPDEVVGEHPGFEGLLAPQAPNQ
jgi:hypothetical protein